MQWKSILDLLKKKEGRSHCWRPSLKNCSSLHFLFIYCILLKLVGIILHQLHKHKSDQLITLNKVFVEKNSFLQRKKDNGHKPHEDNKNIKLLGTFSMAIGFRLKALKNIRNINAITKMKLL